MKRPAALRSQRGLLLVEAALAAVVVAISLVLISRGLAGQLSAVRTVETHERLLALARGKLNALEAAALFGQRPLRVGATGAFSSPEADCEWRLHAARRNDLPDPNQPDQPLAAEVSLTVRRRDKPSAMVQLFVVWPLDWIPAEWF